MPNLKRNFIKGRMNKSVDERLVANGEYIDAMNVRLGSTEETEIGSVENSKGNLLATPALISFNGYDLSTSARCIGAFEDGVNETLYWFVTDPSFNIAGASTGKLDLILSFNIQTNIVTYHVISINDGGGVNTTLNFNSKYLITGVNLVDDMLFFTDDLNAPRKINVTKSYPAPAPAGLAGAIDDVNLATDILVIKAPPIASPSFTLFDSGSQDNFLENRFICFAYRYRYEDNEYSATSQFSDVAFSSKPFGLNLGTFLNEGMINLFNTAEVTYNTGGPLVKGIDLLFKEADNTTIRVIEKIEKFENGTQVLSDNIDATFEFDNSRIYTVLPSSEILRLYDNVPRFAKAQSIMGNRLMYGNYVDGYNLIDKNKNDLRLNYLAELHTDAIDFTDLPPSAITKSVFSSYVGGGAPQNSQLNINLAGQTLSQGSTLFISITFTHNNFGGPGVAPVEKTTNKTIALTFNLQQDYASVQAMVDSQEFRDAVGDDTNIDTMANACVGSTLTDRMRCALPLNLNAYTKNNTGLTGFSPHPNSQGMWLPGAAGSTIQIPLLAALYVNGSATVYEYYKIVTASAQIYNTTNAKSLHSDRDYEVGIVYMDEFNRATTALVSDQTNTVHVPCANSDLQNQVKVIIDQTMLAPSWAKRYKWVMKQDQDTYETVFSQFTVNDPNSNYVWFLLEGENANKVAVGDKLKVKTDSNGAVNTCVFTTVLDKQAQPENFLSPSTASPPSPLSTAGVYMKLNPNNFAVNVSVTNSSVDYGSETIKRGGTNNVTSNPPAMAYTVNSEVGGTYVDDEVPIGSRIEMFIEFRRDGTFLSGCEKNIYTIDQSYIANSSYPNLADWFFGDGINVTQGVSDVDQGVVPNGNLTSGFGLTNTALSGNPIPVPIPSGTTSPIQFKSDTSINKYGFVRQVNNNQLVFALTSGTKACVAPLNDDARSHITCHIKLFKAGEPFVFETEAKDTSPDIFYEGALSYPIDANGFHLTETNPNEPNNIDQDATTAGIAYLDFFNCFAFGNGVESYKIEDSLIGKSFALGNRVTAVAAQDYKEADRFADITYSGIVSGVSNVNKLNEFNLGLANYKSLEESYGSIEILHARKTDLLALQEDRISFVQVGKNLLSDAVGGGAVTSVPEVLGQQIARPEEYGISHNPESFAVYGYDKYFTDAKRGAVLQLRGTSGPNENLIVISEAGMRSWFRDLFNTSFNTQKLGGYDPYMNEFVLSSNDTLLPTVEECVPCGREEEISVQGGAPYTFCVDFSGNVGDVVLAYNITGSASIAVTYNGVTTTTGGVTGSGTFTFSKDVVNVNTASITITAIDGNASLSLAIPCPIRTEMEIIKIVLTSNVNANQSIHNQFRYTAGTYTSRTNSSGMVFKSGSATPIVSQYTRLKGAKGDGIIPTIGSTVTMISSKQGFDNFVFDTNNSKFRYLRSNTLYDGGSLADMTTMIAASTQALPLVSTRAPQQYSADFTMPAGTETYLYLIYDYRDIYQWGLCFDASVVLDVCCNCTHNWYLVRNSADAEEEYFAQSAVALVIGTHYKLRGLGDRCFEVISTTTTRPTQTIDVACTP